MRPQSLSPILSGGEHDRDEEDTSRKIRKKVSFEDYYQTWVNIATSKPISLTHRQSQEEEYGGDLEIDESHFGVLKSDLEDELKRQLSDHNAIIYGRFRNKRANDARKIAELQATKAQLLKQIYSKNKVDGTSIRITRF